MGGTRNSRASIWDRFVRARLADLTSDEADKRLSVLDYENYAAPKEKAPKGLRLLRFLIDSHCDFDQLQAAIHLDLGRIN